MTLLGVWSNLLGKDRGQMTSLSWLRFSQQAHGIDADGGDFVGSELELEVVMFAC